ncbi:DUF116 domain-containing protein [Metallumcola ferriviriculae]|uniref:DUF116 domain-containing protein n=1 Tax=Metallumcola ferriviriculae TaxID=3039180 RepID=A0AAU0UPL5_9FIRM|nr:DUF116 domain-containing protein [Desulfitibacteraceae bacterium MK1]
MPSQKRIYIALLGITVAILGAVVFLAWYLFLNNGSLFNQIVLVLMGSLILMGLGVVGFGVVVLVITLWSHKSFPSLQNLIYTATNLLFPVALQLGKMVGIDADKIKSSFIAVNNQLVDNRDIQVVASQVMILAPHCLQNADCPHKITIDVNNCRRCGKCPIDDLHDIKERYGVHFVVATGGTLARRFVKEIRPRAVVAIACERDLTSGVQDVNPLPVIGVLNIRPQGPCYNTRVNLDQVEDAIRQFTNRRRSVFTNNQQLTET